MIVENLAEILPTPKFKIGERVAYSYICDDPLNKENHGREFVCLGVVLGIVLGWPDSGRDLVHDVCWVYLVRIDADSMPGFKAISNWLENFIESELERYS